MKDKMSGELQLSDSCSGRQLSHSVQRRWPPRFFWRVFYLIQLLITSLCRKTCTLSVRATVLSTNKTPRKICFVRREISLNRDRFDHGWRRLERFHLINADDLPFRRLQQADPPADCLSFQCPSSSHNAAIALLIIMINLIVTVHGAEMNYLSLKTWHGSEGTQRRSCTTRPRKLVSVLTL